LKEVRPALTGTAFLCEQAYLELFGLAFTAEADGANAVEKRD
jgi:hypothetical protein